MTENCHVQLHMSNQLQAKCRACAEGLCVYCGCRCMREQQAVWEELAGGLRARRAAGALQEAKVSTVAVG